MVKCHPALPVAIQTVQECPSGAARVPAARASAPRCQMGATAPEAGDGLRGIACASPAAPGSARVSRQFRSPCQKPRAGVPQICPKRPERHCARPESLLSTRENADGDGALLRHVIPRDMGGLNSRLGRRPGRSGVVDKWELAQTPQATSSRRGAQAESRQWPIGDLGDNGGATWAPNLRRVCDIPPFGQRSSG